MFEKRKEEEEQQHNFASFKNSEEIYTEKIENRKFAGKLAAPKSHVLQQTGSAAVPKLRSARGETHHRHRQHGGIRQ